MGDQSEWILACKSLKLNKGISRGGMIKLFGLIANGKPFGRMSWSHFCHYSFVDKRSQKLHDKFFDNARGYRLKFDNNKRRVTLSNKGRDVEEILLSPELIIVPNETRSYFAKFHYPYCNGYVQ